ncbi:MAG: GNAT family N-acetyltransferase [Pseudomonadota bacterium]
MIETRRLRLRDWRPADRTCLHPVLGDPEVMRFSDRGALCKADQAAWLSNALSGKCQDGLPGCLAIERKHDAAVLGYVGLSRDATRVGQGDAEIGFRLAMGAWGRGYATEAANGIIDDAAQVGLARRVVAIVDPGNTRSLRVIEKLGMTFERDILFDGYDHPDHLYARQIA